MPRVRVERPSGAVSVNKREYAILQQLGGGTGEFDSQELAAMERYGDKAKMDALSGDVSFETFAGAFSKPPTAAEHEGQGDCIGWMSMGPKEPMKPWRFPRRTPNADDVVIQITYSGMCHSDVHQVRNEWGNSMYPMVPGHEVLGVVVATGGDVTRFKVGDYAAVGCMVDSCMTCARCKAGDEHYCLNGSTVMTYNAKDKQGQLTFGGYSTHIVCKEHFVFTIDRNMHEASTAPLLCAGITVFEPMKVYGVDKPGMKVGVVGLGGLGHMVAKFAKAFGQECTAISRSYAKKDWATKELGVDGFVAMSDPESVKDAAETLDAIIDTVSDDHDMTAILGMLKVDGQLILVGAPERPHKIPAWDVLSRRRSVRGSFIGGVPMTQAMLDFCRDNGIRCDVEVVDIAQVNTAFDRMVRGDVKFRFVIDNLKGLQAEG